jgi:hypothetical protein
MFTQQGNEMQLLLKDKSPVVPLTPLKFPCAQSEPKCSVKFAATSSPPLFLQASEGENAESVYDLNEANCLGEPELFSGTIVTGMV